MAKTFDRERAAWMLALAIVLLALILRMAWPALTPFKRDEATVTRLALSIAHEGYRPVVGVDTSTGTDNLPLTLYLLALPLRLWADPIAAVLFTGLLNGLAVLACYGLGRAYFGRRVGLIAAFLFAVSPWAVIYGRKIWAQNLPLITLAFIASLMATFARGRRWALVGAFASLAALIGLHLGGLAFIPVLLIVMLIYRRQVALKPLLVGAGVFALALAPYVIHDALNGWPNLQDFLNYAGGEGHFSWDALRYAFFMMGSHEIEGRMAGGLHQAYRDGLPNLWRLNWALMGALALAIPYAAAQAIRGPEERWRPLMIMLIWFATPIAMQTRPTAEVHPFYFNLLYPVQFLLVGLLSVDLLDRLPRGRWRSAALSALTLALLILGAWQIAVVGRVFYFMDRRPSTGGHGIPLKYTRAAALEARRLVDPPALADDETAFVVLSAETSPAMHETPAVFEALLFDRPRCFADGRGAIPIPDRTNVVYVVGPLAGEAAAFAPTLDRLASWERVQPGPTIELPDGVRYRLFHRRGSDREGALADVSRFDEAFIFANGVEFLGYDAPTTASLSERELTVWLAWQARTPPPPDARYHLFVHLLAEDGALRGQYDSAAFPTPQWQAGDLVLSRFPIPIPDSTDAGRYQVWAGLYTYPDVVNVSYLDAAGNPAGELVLLQEVMIK